MNEEQRKFIQQEELAGQYKLKNKKDYDLMRQSLSTSNINLTDEEYKFIVTLEKFDLIMLLSDIDDARWPTARKTLGVMREALTIKEGH